MTESQQQLVREHADFARVLAWSFARKISWVVSTDDLHGVANEALAEAATSFDEGVGRPFRSWAQSKIWWAMQDFARRQDPNSRKARAAYARGEKHFRKTKDGRVVEVPPIKTCEIREDIYGHRDDLERTVIRRLDLVAALRTIPRREAYVLLRAAVGFEGQETARELGVSESRVSQIRTSGARKVALLVAA